MLHFSIFRSCKININNIGFKKILLLIIFIYLINIYSFNNSFSNNDYLINNIKKYNIFNYFDNNKEYKLINLNLTQNDYIAKGLLFLDKIINLNLNNISKTINSKDINPPKISVIIPIYNCENTIELAVKSIFYQNLKEIEIILVNDFSSDNSLERIEKLKALDQRIKIINNIKNMGTLYSRCIGVLKANGEYIIGLDNDDFFLSEDTFETFYLNAKINNFDIVEIKSLNIPNYSPDNRSISIGDFLDINDNLILYQPDLGRFPISYNNQFNNRDHFAWGKCIETNIYKKAVNKMGKKRYSFYNCWTEDISIVFIIFNLAKSFIFLNQFGIFHLKAITTTTFKLSNKHKFLTDIFYLGIIFDFSQNDSISKGLVAQFALSFSIESLNQTDINDKLNFQYYIKKILNCEYISLEYKDKIISKYNSTILNI